MEEESWKPGADGKYWSQPSSTALERLDEIQASISHMQPASALNVQSIWAPHSSYAEVRGRGSKASPYMDLETQPPLSSLSYQKTAWGSNTSITDLIKQQGERQQQVNTRNHHRPWSGRKASPGATAQKRSGKPDKSKSTDENKYNQSFIEVKGSKSIMNEPGSRIPNGQTPPSAANDVFAQMEAVNRQNQADDEDEALKYFLQSQLDQHRHDLSKLSGAFADDFAITPPPPPPCVSPDLDSLVSGELDEKEEEETHIYQTKTHDDDTIRKTKPIAPQLLRRPTPEPLRVSMTIPGADGEDSSEEDSSTESNGSPDIELQSVTSEVSAHVAPPSSPSHSGITSISVTPRGGTTTIVQNDLGSTDERNQTVPTVKSRGKPSVHIAEERNVTFDITPRNAVSARRPRPPSANKTRQRPSSALRSSDSRKNNANRLASAAVKNLVEQNSELDNDDEDDDVDDLDHMNNNTMDAMNDSVTGKPFNLQKRGNRKHDVETMMSRLALMDENHEKKDANLGSSPTSNQTAPPTNVPISSTASKQNYYEQAILAKKRTMYGKQTSSGTLTTKEIKFGEAGPSMETKAVSYLQVVAPPTHTRMTRPGSSRGPRRGWEENSGSTAGRPQVNRPVMEKKSFVEKQLQRPDSRLGCYQDMDVPDAPHQGDLNEVSQVQAVNDAGSLAKQRVRPKSATFKTRRDVSPHRCDRKSPTRLKERPHSSFISGAHSKKVGRRSSSPSSQSRGNSSRAISPTLKKTKVDVQRNRAAVKALRDGTLKKTKKFDKQVPVEDSVVPVRPYRSRKSQNDDDEGSDDDSIDEYPKSVKEEEAFNLHRRLLGSGVNVSYKTLKRGLVAPEERNLQQCLEQLPRNVSLTLLNKPEAWLGETYERYRIANDALKRADLQLALQEEKAAREAAALLEAMKKRNGKKRKKKGLKKRTKSPASGRSTSAKTPSSAKTPANSKPPSAKPPSSAKSTRSEHEETPVT